MGSANDTAQRRYRVAITIVTMVGLYHGAVPLIVHGMFERDQRFAPALWLPTPWWWIACGAITASAALVVVLLDAARQRHVAPIGPPAVDIPPAADSPAPTNPASDRTGVHDTLSGLVFLVGLYNGVAPLIARLVFDSNLLFALPLRLSTPWWWLTSLAVIAVSVVLFAVIEHTKQRPRDR